MTIFDYVMSDVQPSREKEFMHNRIRISHLSLGISRAVRLGSLARAFNSARPRL
jgi:hypothetical protein